MADKNAQSSTVRKRKKRSTAGDKNMFFAFRMQPISRAVIDIWIEQLKVYPFRKPQPKSMIEFFHEIAYSRDTFEKELKKHEDLKEQYSKTKEMVGYNLWGRCVDGNANWNAVKFMIHEYSNDFAKAKALEKESATNQQGIVVVHVPEITSKKDKE